MTRLFHVSEDPKIEIFTPRAPLTPKAGVTGDAVWAIDHDHLPHYLLPRQCPRVTLRRGPATSVEDAKRFFADGVEKLIAIEMQWYERVRSARLFVYELPAATFSSLDSVAGYYISRAAVRPLSVKEEVNVIERIAAEGYKLRFLPNLWPLQESVVASTVQYSIIRMRNAQAKVK